LRLLADENFLSSAVERLRSAGHDIIWIRDDAPGSADVEVLRRAAEEERVLLTFDTDFGFLSMQTNLSPSCGVVLFRIAPSSRTNMVEFIVRVIESRTDWAGHVSVVQERRIRMRRLRSR
jgi:predicted nuclease of predicted toxin-antitoxin system